MKAHWNGQPREQVTIEGVVIYGEGKSHTGKGNDEVNKIRMACIEEIQSKTSNTLRKGKNEVDKRQTIKERDWKREQSKVIKQYNIKH